MLNEHQKRAVRTVKGRVLVLAGAGSGKTGVIVHRIAHLIKDLDAPPTSILGLTFTNKAAAEMRHRVQGLVGIERAKQITLSTFHSFCMQVLRKEIQQLGYTRDFSLYDERDVERLIGQITRDILGHEGELPSMAPTKTALATYANQGIFDAKGEKTWHDDFSKDLYLRLHTTLRAYNAVSFDSLITLTIRLFEEHPKALERYQDRFRYLMIDEYQDTNPAQFRLAELLAAKYGNLCVVGDDDQSIYGWRGAEVGHILHFKADETIKLEQNYRSTPYILDAANAVIRNNKSRHDKRLWTSEKAGEMIEVFNAPTDVDEAAAIIARILKLKEKENLRFKDIAILYRSNALSRAFEMALMQTSWQKDGKWIRGIPYEVFGGLEFAERAEIKDLLAYLRVIANPLDQEALLRIINVPRRGVSDPFLDTLTQQNRAEHVPLWNLLEEIASGKKAYPNNPKAVSGVRSFVDLIHTAKAKFKKPPLADTLSWLIEKIDYKKAIEEEVKSEKMREFKWENIQECVSALAQYEVDSEEPSVQDFIATTTLARQRVHNQTKEMREDRVHLMTFHSAKGLEFPACFLAGLEDGILPHEKGMAETGLEEERRLFYVGITRARRFLTLSMARSRMKMGKPYPTNPSRFLFEVPKHLFKVVDHKVF
ncbi:MAG: ATP-dependent DNA helicase [Chlamydiae bacterium RIFCSPHIGHO2_12_FULL_49_9]|nr:MAG: ATP-dependent DNA helicase [Chlamydiae bacterium RIFCSPHIGHO2_12_FULL_49_9]